MQWKNLIQTKPLNDDAAIPSELHRCLSAFDLTLLGIGAIIGAGIFVLTGVAAATKAGPAIMLSFLLAGLSSTFSALSINMALMIANSNIPIQSRKPTIRRNKKMPRIAGDLRIDSSRCR